MLKNNASDYCSFEDLPEVLMAIIEQSPATVVITDKDGLIEYVNPRFTELTGYSAEEAYGKNPSILKSGYHDNSLYRDMWDEILSGRIWRGEFLNRKKDGSLYWEQASISAFRDGCGNITHFLAIKEDVTVRKMALEALKESEEKLKARNRIYEKDIRYARDVIKQLLPQKPPVMPGLRISYRYIPQESIGGDLLAFMPEEGRLGFFIGDVTGHGLSAALFLAMVKSAIGRIFPEKRVTPSEFLKSLNGDVSFGMGPYFLTAIYGYIEPEADGADLVFARGGHCPMAVHYRDTGNVEYEAPSGRPLGLFDNVSFETRKIRLKPGDRFYLYTDGINETVNNCGKELGYDGLSEIIKDTSYLDIDTAVDRIIERAGAFRNKNDQNDDIILIGFEFTGNMSDVSV